MAIKNDLDVEMDPDLIAVLEIQSDLACGRQEVDLETDAVLEVAKDVADVDADDGDSETDFKRVGINVAGNLRSRKNRLVKMCLRTDYCWIRLIFLLLWCCKLPAVEDLERRTLTGPKLQSIWMRPSPSPGGRLRTSSTCLASQMLSPSAGGDKATTAPVQAIFDQQHAYQSMLFKGFRLEAK